MVLSIFLKINLFKNYLNWPKTGVYICISMGALGNLDLVKIKN
jgi:hypothetical protein